jgi:hypothetical protein
VRPGAFVLTGHGSPCPSPCPRKVEFLILLTLGDFPQLEALALLPPGLLLGGPLAGAGASFRESLLLFLGQIHCQRSFTRHQVIATRSSGGAGTVAEISMRYESIRANGLSIQAARCEGHFLRQRGNHRPSHQLLPRRLSHPVLEEPGDFLCYIEPILGGSLLQSRADDGFKLPLAGGHEGLLSAERGSSCAFQQWQGQDPEICGMGVMEREGRGAAIWPTFLFLHTAGMAGFT